MKTKRVRDKECAQCRATPEALFRARVAPHGAWTFLCRSCLLRAKEGNEHYQYGGTWKRRKRH